MMHRSIIVEGIRLLKRGYFQNEVFRSGFVFMRVASAVMPSRLPCKERNACEPNIYRKSTVCEYELKEAINKCKQLHAPVSLTAR